MFSKNLISFTKSLVLTTCLGSVPLSQVVAMEDDGSSQRSIGFSISPSGKILVEGHAVSRDELVDHLTNQCMRHMLGGAVGPALSSSSSMTVRDPYREKGQEIIDLLAQFYTKQVSGQGRLEQAKAKRHNELINKDKRASNLKFEEILGQQKLSKAFLQSLSTLVYGLQKRETHYYEQMKSSMRAEMQALSNGQVVEGGYASDMIDPSNKNARLRFLQDAFQIFDIAEDTSKTIDSGHAKANFENFYDFAKSYLGLVRDLTGVLFSRNQALMLVSQKLPTDHQELTETDADARIKVFSMHYLGEVERLLQTIEILQPLANAAFAVNHQNFPKAVVNDHVAFARTELARLLFEEHGIQAEDRGQWQVPSGLPEKPLSKNQRKKLRQQKQKETIRAQIQTQQAEPSKAGVEEVNETQAPSPVKVTQPQRLAAHNTYDHLLSWLEGGKTENAKKESLARAAELEAKEARKAELKAQKEKGASSSSQDAGSSSGSKVENDAFTSNVKTVVHAPHKNGSAKLRKHHVVSIRDVLEKAGYNLQTVHERGMSSPSPSRGIELSGNVWNTFQSIFDKTYSGEMDSVTSLIEALGGYVDETRSGSRIGILLRHIKTRDIVGTDLIAKGQ